MSYTIKYAFRKPGYSRVDDIFPSKLKAEGQLDMQCGVVIPDGARSAGEMRRVLSIRRPAAKSSKLYLVQCE